MWRLASLAAAALALAGCGGHSNRSAGAHVRVESFGHGSGRVWVFEPPGKPTSAVVFLHGAGSDELYPRNHWGWLSHLARGGSLVYYPKYETVPGAGQPPGIVAALRAATAHVSPADLPALAIGYSRGAWLVFPYATAADRSRIRVRAVLSIFPSSPEAPYPDFGLLPAGTQIEVLAGDHDRVVGKIGAAQVLTLLAYAHYPHELTGAALVRSHDGFSATHLSPLVDSRGSKREYWARADRLLEQIKREKRSS